MGLSTEKTTLKDAQQPPRATRAAHMRAVLLVNLAIRRQLLASQMNSDAAEATSVQMARHILKTAMPAMLLVTSLVRNRSIFVFALWSRSASYL